MKIFSLIAVICLAFSTVASTNAAAAPIIRPSHASHTSHSANMRSNGNSIHTRYGHGQGVFYGGVDQDDDTCGWYHHRHRMFPLGILLHLGLNRC